MYRIDAAEIRPPTPDRRRHLVHDVTHHLLAPFDGAEPALVLRTHPVDEVETRASNGANDAVMSTPATGPSAPASSYASSRPSRN
ncbi:hypothetical protein ACFO4E_10690 [Nocardiopsis mangrovi]|uniref:Uncharacterized protein n=1 Tax=Nocardiopsis mangrovi TaxID=1179818 RepID=A0ABV9DUF2_9ACTN